MHSTECGVLSFDRMEISRSLLQYKVFWFYYSQGTFLFQGLTAPDCLHKSARAHAGLKLCIIPNICILISSVTLTRTAVNKAINQTSVEEGRETGRGEEGVQPLPQPCRKIGTAVKWSFCTIFLFRTIISTG